MNGNQFKCQMNHEEHCVFMEQCSRILREARNLYVERTQLKETLEWINATS